MSRIGTYGASQMYMSRLAVIQTRLNKTQIQVSTELKSQSYSGIASDSNRVINLENEKARADAYVRDNDLASTRLNATTVSMDAITKTVKDFQKRLEDFSSNTNTTAQSVQQLQQWAFQAMQDMQSYLAANVDGQYIFSGGRVSDEPVKMPAGTLQAFQQMFDGSAVTYPTTRSASLAEVHLTAADTGALTFNTAAGTITAATNAFDGLAAGTRITMAGVQPPTSFTIQGVNPATNTIKVSQLTSEAAPAATIDYATGTTGAGTLSAATLGGLTFSPQGDTITAGLANVGIPELAPGKTFTIANSASNNGTYEVVSNNGTTIQIKSTKLDFVQPTTTETAATIGGVASAAYGQLTFGTNASGALTISASTAASLGGAGPVFAAPFAVGNTFTVAGAAASGDNGTYQVVANAGGTTLTVTRVTGGNYTMPTGAGTTFDADSWYQGDNIALQHQIDTDRSVDLGVYASDPAFEKAFRALGLIAQGAYGTGGGLENHLNRVDQARALLQDAVSRNTSAPGPFGVEQAGDLSGLAAKIGVTQGLIKTKNDKHKAFSGFLQTRVSDLVRVDKTEAVAMLLDDQNALQASYQSLATVRGLSLLNYMK